MGDFLELKFVCTFNTAIDKIDKALLRKGRITTNYKFEKLSIDKANKLLEKLEKELQRQYEIYIEKYRNLDYLEHELQEYVRNEEEKKQERDARLKKMRERLNKEEVELLRGGKGRDDDDDKAGSKITRGNDTRQQGASGNRDVKRVQGSMTGGDSESSEGEEDDEDEDDNSQSMEDNRRGESKYGGGKTANRGAAKKSDADSEDFVDDDDEDDDDDEFSESSDNF
jgi:clusterin-associated protein 1